MFQFKVLNSSEFEHEHVPINGLFDYRRKSLVRVSTDWIQVDNNLHRSGGHDHHDGDMTCAHLCLTSIKIKSHSSCCTVPDYQGCLSRKKQKNFKCDVSLSSDVFDRAAVSFTQP